MVMFRGGTLLEEAPESTVVVPSWPSEPEPGWEPPPLPDQPGARGTEWSLLVCRFPTGEPLGVIWDAEIERVGRQTYGRGPASLSVSVPATAENVAVLGSDPLRIELAVCVDGLVLERYVMRQPWTHGGSQIRLEGQTYDALLRERVIGPPGRPNRVAPIKPGLAGWSTRNGASATVHAGGPDGSHFVRVTGPVGSYLASAVRLTAMDLQWVGRPVGAAALVRVPLGDWDRYQLVSLHIWDYLRSRWAWPPADGTTDGEFSDSMYRGVWLADEISAQGVTPPMPFDVRAEIRLHALGSGSPVDYAAPVLGTPFNDGLAVPPPQVPDLSAVLGFLLLQAQDASERRQKSSWGLAVETKPVGVAEAHVWMHGDRLPLTEAIAELVERDDGPDLWADGAIRRFKVAKRRGRNRTDVAIMPWDVLDGPPTWQHDPGGQVTGLHVLSSASAQYGGGDVGIRDTSRSGGQLIEATVQSPDRMTRNQMRRWGGGKLKTLRHAQITTTLLVRWSLGRLLAVGDTVAVHLENGAARLNAELRVTAWTAIPGRNAVQLELGTDPVKGV